MFKKKKDSKRVNAGCRCRNQVDGALTNDVNQTEVNNHLTDLIIVNQMNLTNWYLIVNSCFFLCVKVINPIYIFAV